MSALVRGRGLCLSVIWGNNDYRGCGRVRHSNVLSRNGSTLIVCVCGRVFAIRRGDVLGLMDVRGGKEDERVTAR